MAIIVVKLGENVIQTFELGQDPASIGRARDNDIIVENLSVSRHHANIVFEDAKYVLVDNRSANGVFVNGVKINRAELADNDIVSIGKHRLHYSASGTASQVTQGKTQIEENGPLEPIIGQDGIPRIPYLTVNRGNLMGLIYPLKNTRSTIGRSHQNDVRINDWLVSRQHASIIYQNGTFKIEDLGSWHGTTVNAESIREKEVNPEDEILMGNSLLKFSMATPDELTEDSKLFSFAQGVESATNGAFLSLPISRISFEGSGGGFESASQATVATPAASHDDVPLAEEDEFAPMTQEELEALELEADDAGLQVDEDDLARVKLEDMEARKLKEDGGGWNAETAIPGMDTEESQKTMESSQFEAPEPSELLEDEELAGDDNIHLEDAEEEKALFGGAIENIEPGSIDATPKPLKEEITGAVAVDTPGSGELEQVSSNKPSGLVPIPKTIE